MNRDRVLNAYIECALWSSTDDNGDPLDGLGYELSDSLRASMREDVNDFLESNEFLLLQSGLSDPQIGHDFWLTRNRHGAGFWDRGLPEDISKPLTDNSHAYGSIDLYVSLVQS